MPKYEYMVIEVPKLDDDWLLHSDTALSRLIYLSKADKEKFERNKDEFYESMQELDGSGITAVLDMTKQIIVNSRRLGEEELEEIEGMVKEKEVGGMLSRFLGSTLEEGRIKGRLEGRLEEKRNDILEILEARFGDVPEDIKEAIGKISDLKKLSILVRKSAVVRNIEEFRGFLEQ